MTNISRQNSPEIFYRVKLKDVPLGQKLDLSCNWSDPSGQMYLTDVCGNTTYSRDYLGRNCHLPALEIGDIIGILDVGAYGYAMSSHFLHRPRPAEVLLESNTHRLIRKREDYSVLLSHQVFNNPCV